jgi:uncharacterized membrane protein YfcA
LDILTFVLLLAVGCAAGFLAGFFGVGGGILLVPALLFYYQTTTITSLVTTHLAFGTSLLIIIFASASSAYKYDRGGYVLWRGVLLMGIGSVVGALIGSAIAAMLQGRTLRQIFAVVLVVAAVRLLNQPRKPKGNLPPDLGAQKLLPAGLFVGLLSALAGVGGGVLAIPVMYSLFRFPLKKALGTSSAIITITAFAGAVGYAVKGWGMQGLPNFTLGFVDYLIALPLILGSLPLAMVGAAVAEKTRPDTLRKIFALLLIVVAAKMFLG